MTFLYCQYFFLPLLVCPLRALWGGSFKDGSVGRTRQKGPFIEKPSHPRAAPSASGRWRHWLGQCLRPFWWKPGSRMRGDVFVNAHTRVPSHEQSCTWSPRAGHTLITWGGLFWQMRQADCGSKEDWDKLMNKECVRETPPNLILIFWMTCFGNPLTLSWSPCPEPVHLWTHGHSSLTPPAGSGV